MTIPPVFRAIYAWLHATDLRTWIGHGVQGFLLAFIHPAFAFGAFAHREVSDILAGKWTRQKRRDCVMDFIFPALGVALQQALVAIF